MPRMSVSSAMIASSSCPAKRAGSTRPLMKCAHRSRMYSTLRSDSPHDAQGRGAPAQHALRRQLAAAGAEAPPHRIGRLHRDLLADDRPRQRAERVAARREGDARMLGDDPGHRRVRLRERALRAAPVGRAGGSVHTRRQVVPPGPSSRTTPSAVSAARMRSASAKFLAFLAAARSAISASIRAASSSSPAAAQELHRVALQQAERLREPPQLPRERRRLRRGSPRSRGRTAPRSPPAC